MWSDQNGNSWVTLTYRDIEQCNDVQLKKGQYIPQDFSLRPSDVSKFIRALRKKREYQYDDEGNVTNPIKYFYCGEYGELGRPHYHLCIFNHTFDDIKIWRDDEGLYTYTSQSLEKLWPFGFSTVQPLSYRNAAYTAGYVFKKVTGQRAHDHYLRCDEYGVAYWLKPEFVRMSTGNKNPPCGLGARFYEKFKSDFFPADVSPVPGKGTMRQVPRYYQNILQSEDPKQLELVKDLRQTFLREHRDDFTPERLRAKYKCAKANHNLKRKLG